MTSLMCALMEVKAGKFDWPSVMHEGRAWIKQDLETNKKVQLLNLEVRIPLSEQFKSEFTSLNCYLEFPKGSYPMGNGRHIILSW
jgi:hypothetical protein